MTCLYVLILFVGIHTLAIHRVPFRMAIYMLVLLGVAVAFGLLLSRNAFCARVCPVGHLLGLYARLAPMGWGVRDKSVCLDCKDRSCIASRTAYTFQGRSCGVGLRPAELRDNPGLAERPNPGWFPRRWFQDLWELEPLSAAQAAFCLVVSGFVLYEIVTEWSVTGDLLLWTPTRLEQALGVSGVWGHGMVRSLTLFVALPAAFWLLPYGVFRLVGGRLTLGDYVRRFGIVFIPIMAAAHAVKALLKTTSRIPYWEHVVTDPVGGNTARGILDGTVSLASLPAWREPAMTILALGLMGVATLVSLLVARRLIAAQLAAPRWRGTLLYLTPGLYAGVYLAMLMAWRLG